MTRICLDTSAYVQFRRGESQAVDICKSAAWIGMPAVVLGELWMGFLGGSKVGFNEEKLQQFMVDPVVEEIVVDGSVARLFAEISVTLRKSGTPIPVNDIWIAACAARHGAVIVTFDSHFQSITRVGSIVLSPTA